MATTTTRFSESVRAKLTANAVADTTPSTVGELARVMGRGSKARARTYRRSLFKWLSPAGPHPSTVSRALVADALGIPASELAEPDDDEESELPSDLFMRACRAAFKQIASERGAALAHFVPTLAVWAAVFALLATGWTF